MNCPAKVNLRLTVLARDETGYHQLDTLFCALRLADRLEVDIDPQTGPPGLHLEVHGADLGPPEQNLVYRAAARFFDAAGLPPRAHLRLHKRIPAGTGLGGASSDAAATLTALNRLHGEPLPPARLLALAAELGSDVPFFLSATPFALGWGRGERLLALPPPPPAPVLLAIPSIRIPTADAYRWLDERRARRPAPLRPTLTRVEELSTWDTLALTATNDFEEPAFARYPVLQRIHAALLATGPHLARLAGSGSALFAVYPDLAAASAAHARLAADFPDLTLILTETATTPPPTPANQGSATEAHGTPDPAPGPQGPPAARAAPHG